MENTEEIIENNCEGLCCQKHCNKKETRFAEIKLHGLACVVGFCNEHAKKFDAGKGAIKSKRI